MSGTVVCPYCMTEQAAKGHMPEGYGVPYHKQVCPECGHVFAYYGVRLSPYVDTYPSMKIFN